MANHPHPSVLKSAIGDIFVGVQFLSRLPIPQNWLFGRGENFSLSLWAVPFATLIISLPAVLIAAAALGFGLPTAAMILLLIGSQIWVTGALHEDGLADVADGFGGGTNATKKLEIMKDSRIGAYGVIAIVLALLLRAALLMPFFETAFITGLFVFLASQILSRSLMIAFWATLPAARYRGLSHQLGRPSKQTARNVMLFGVVLCLPLFFFVLDLIAIATIALLSTATFLLFRRMCWKHIRGQTGDTMGACQISSEISVLMGASFVL